MKFPSRTRLFGFWILTIFILLPGYCRAGDIALAESLRAKMRSADGFEASFIAKSAQGKKDIRINVFYRRPDLVRIEIPTQQTLTVYNGEMLLVVDKPSAGVIAMNMASVKELIKNASVPIEDLESWIEPARLREYQNLNAFVSVGLTKTGIDVAVDFSVIPADAVWLRRMELDQATVAKGQKQITLRHGEYNLIVDAGNGMLLAMKDKSSDSGRSLEMIDLKMDSPSEELFNILLDGRFAVKKVDPSESLVNTVVQRQFQMILRDLLRKEAPRWTSLDKAQKKQISGAIRQYWRIVFQSNTHLKTKLSALAVSKESRELILMQWQDAKAFLDFKARGAYQNDEKARAAWAEAVGRAFTQQILREALAPVRRGIVLDGVAYSAQLCKRTGLDEKEAARMLQAHIDPMENALIETLGMTVFEKISGVVKEFAVK
jgi:hypothetical protein